MPARFSNPVVNLWPTRRGSRWNVRQIALERDVVGHLAGLRLFGGGTDGPTQNSRAIRLEVGYPWLIQTLCGMADKACADAVIVRDVAQPVPHPTLEQWPINPAIPACDQPTWHIGRQIAQLGHGMRIERHQSDWPVISPQIFRDSLFKLPIRFPHLTMLILELDQQRHPPRDQIKQGSKGRNALGTAKQGHSGQIL